MKVTLRDVEEALEINESGEESISLFSQEERQAITDMGYESNIYTEDDPPWMVFGMGFEIGVRASRIAARGKAI